MATLAQALLPHCIYYALAQVLISTRLSSTFPARCKDERRNPPVSFRPSYFIPESAEVTN